jgi:hypothetical protein
MKMRSTTQRFLTLVPVPVFLCLAGTLHAQSFPFTVSRTPEVVAEIEMSSPGADWSKPGREAALVRLVVDHHAPQHIMLFAGEEQHTYAAFLGSLEAGPHALQIEREAQYSAPGAQVKVWGAHFREVPKDSHEWTVLAHAPILYARADTVGEFTDIPLLAYCEQLTDGGQPVLQYTMIFSNEDGGTSTRALMARWGRTNDVENIYTAWLNPRGEVERATIQAKDHKVIDFNGKLEGSHPFLIPSTRNNMVSAEGSSAIRYQIPPQLVDLGRHSREEVIDEHPIGYRVMAQELEREDKLRPYGAVDGEKVSDPRNYLYLEMSVKNRDSALGALVRLHGETVWHSSYLGRTDYAISRDGWVQTTIELPPGTRPEQVEEFGFECLVRSADPPRLAGACNLHAVSKVFQLDSAYRPLPSIWQMTTAVDLPTGTLKVFPTALPGASTFGR